MGEKTARKLSVCFHWVYADFTTRHPLLGSAFSDAVALSSPVYTGWPGAPPATTICGYHFVAHHPACWQIATNRAVEAVMRGSEAGIHAFVSSQ